MLRNKILKYKRKINLLNTQNGGAILGRNRSDKKWEELFQTSFDDEDFQRYSEIKIHNESQNIGINTDNLSEEQKKKIEEKFEAIYAKRELEYKGARDTLLEQLEEENISLKENIKDIKSLNDSYFREISKYKVENNDLKQTIQNITIDLSNITEKFEESERRKKSAENKNLLVDSLAEELEKIQNALKEYIEENKMLKTDNERMKSIQTNDNKKDEQIKLLIAEKNEIKSERDTLRNSLAKNLTDQQTLASESIAQIKKLIDLNNSNALLPNDTVELKQKLTDLSTLHETLAKKDKEILELQNEKIKNKISYDGEIQILTKKIEYYTDTISVNNTKFKGLQKLYKTTTAQLKSKIDDLNNEITKLTSDNTNLTDKLNSKIIEITGENEKLNSKIAELNSKITELTGENEKLNSKITKLNSKISKLMYENKNLLGSIKPEYEKIIKLNSNIFIKNKGLLEYNNNITTENEQLRQKILELLKYNIPVTQQVDINNEKYKELEKKYELAIKNKNELVKDIENLEELVTYLRRNSNISTGLLFTNRS